METSTSLEHLAPSVRPYALEDNDSRILRIRSDRWIAIPHAESIISRIDYIYTQPRKVRMPCLLVTAPSGMGKSMIAKRFFRDHRPHFDETTGETTMPVLLIDMTEVTTPRRFYRRILEELGVPTAKQQSVDMLEDLAFRLLRRVSIRLLIADEIQDILAGTARQQRGCLNLLKLLSNRLQLSIVALGVQDAAIAIAVDPQMSSRFPRIEIPLWREDDSFRGLLDAFERALPLRRPSKLNAASSARFLLKNSNGTTGGIVSLITDAAVHAVRSGTERVDESCLRESVETMRSLEVPA